MKKLLTLMAVCLLALASGCGGQSQSTTSAKEPVELHVSAAASLTDVMNEIGKAYEEEHPDVKVVFNYGSSGRCSRPSRMAARRTCSSLRRRSRWTPSTRRAC